MSLIRGAVNVNGGTAETNQTAKLDPFSVPYRGHSVVSMDLEEIVTVPSDRTMLFYSAMTTSFGLTDYHQPTITKT